MVDNLNNSSWPSLLEYLGLGSIFSNLPSFDQSVPLFQACISTLCASEEEEVVFYLYDRLFAENLNQISALPQINSSFLLQIIKEQQQKKSFEILSVYATSLTEKPSETIHDLILYLAWDRMCVCMARLFDYQSKDPKFIRAIDILRGCLIESYQHIAQQGRTNPSLYRMLESLVFYEMREENLENHNDAEWATLSQSFQALSSQDQLLDAHYIDDAVAREKGQEIEEEDSEYLISDSPNRINPRLALAHYMTDKLRSEVANWDYVLRPIKINYSASSIRT